MPEAIIDLPDIIQSLQNKRWTGTLEIISTADPRRCYMFLRDGMIQHARPDHSRVVLGRALYELKLIDEADYHMSLVDFEKTGRRLGEALVELGLVGQNEVRSALMFQGREDVLDAFNWTRIDAKFHPGDPPLPAAWPNPPEISLNLSGMSVLMEAAKRADEFGLVREFVKSDDDVLAPTAEQLPEGLIDRRMALLIDGYRSAREIAEGAPVNVQEGVKALGDLVRDGHLRCLAPDELARVGGEAEQDREFGKALTVYELAAARGLDDVDLQRRIARCYHQLGRTQEALQRWQDLAQRCLDAKRTDIAIEALREAIALDPQNVDARARAAPVLVAAGLGDEAAQHLRTAIELAEKAPATRRVELMDQYLELKADDKDILRRVAELHVAGDDKIQAMARYDELATVLLGEGRNEEAVATYYKILEIDSECLDARLLLAQTLGKMGSTDDAVREYKRLADILYGSGVIGNSINWSFLIQVYESIVELEPSSTPAWEWLAKAYVENKEPALAISRYLGMAQSLEPPQGEPPPPEIVQPLRKVIELDPMRFDVRRRLANTHLALNAVDRAVRALRELAEVALQSDQVDAAREAYEEALHHAPFDMDSRRGLAGIHERRGEVDQAQVAWRAIGGMCLRAGLLDDACQDLRRALKIRRDDTEAMLDYARAEEARGRGRDAAMVYTRYAEFMIAQGSPGMARSVLERAQQLQPDLPQAAALMSRIGAAQ